MLNAPYVGEIRMWPADFAPKGWLMCDGRTIPISEGDMLFNLIYTTYGGDGQTNFGLPDFKGRVPACFGKNPALPEIKLAQPAGREQVSMSMLNMPAHSHSLNAQLAVGNINVPTNNVFADTGSLDLDYALGSVTADSTLGAQSLSSVGQGVPYDINQPSLPINFIICMDGIYPSQAV